MLDFNDPNNLNEILKYMKSIDLDRNKRWINVSDKFNCFNEYISVTIQGVGKLDSKLIIEDDIWISRRSLSDNMLTLFEKM